MKSKQCLLKIIITILIGVNSLFVHSQVKTVKINLGGGSPSTSETWNILSDNWASGLASILNTDNTNSNLSLTYTKQFAGVGSSGMTTGYYPTEVMKSYFFVYTDWGTSQIVLSGFDNSKKYKIELFASRQHPGSLVGDSREGMYSVNSGSAITFSPIDKTTQSSELTFTSISPINGNITIEVKTSPTSNNAYLNAFVITENSGGGGDILSPSVPSNLTVSGITQTGGNLSWTASTDNIGVIGYDVFQSGTFLKTVTTTSTSITGLICNTSYTFTVKAKDAAENISAASSAKAFTTSACSGDIQSPSVPSNLTVSGITQTGANLSWTASTDNIGVIGYDVFQSGTFLKTVTTTSTSITDLICNTSYTFTVKARDAAGNISTASTSVPVSTSSCDNGGSSLWKNNGTDVWLTTGKVGIGTTKLTTALTVNGEITAEKITVLADVPAADYVFAPNYKLISLTELENFISLNSHLPEVPSATEFKQNGYSIGEMDNLLLQKIEELTLYIIELQKQVDALKEKGE